VLHISSRHREAEGQWGDPAEPLPLSFPLLYLPPPWLPGCFVWRLWSVALVPALSLTLG